MLLRETKRGQFWLGNLKNKDLRGHVMSDVLDASDDETPDVGEGDEEGGSADE